MQLSVLFHMMRYFSENIVTLKKKSVYKYIVGCIIAYTIYFTFYMFSLIQDYLGQSYSSTVDYCVECLYVICNALVSVFSVMSCKHIIYKLKFLYSSVCNSVSLPFGGNR